MTGIKKTELRPDIELGIEWNIQKAKYTYYLAVPYRAADPITYTHYWTWTYYSGDKAWAEKQAKMFGLEMPEIPDGQGIR